MKVVNVRTTYVAACTIGSGNVFCYKGNSFIVSPPDPWHPDQAGEIAVTDLETGMRSTVSADCFVAACPKAAVCLAGLPKELVAP